MPNYDEPTNPNLGAVPQRINTGTYSGAYAFAQPPQGYDYPPPPPPPPPQILESRLIKLWQVIIGFVLAGITIVGAGFAFASNFFVTQGEQNKANVAQAVMNAQLQNAVTENSRNTERLEKAIDKLSDRIENLTKNERSQRQR